LLGGEETGGGVEIGVVVGGTVLVIMVVVEPVGVSVPLERVARPA
jgi:hypothetical protein